MVNLAKTVGLPDLNVPVGSTTVTSTWLQPRVYFLSSLSSTYQPCLTQLFAPFSGNVASRVHTQWVSSYFFGCSFLSCALLVSLDLLDAEYWRTRGFKSWASSLFTCKQSQVMSTSLLLIAAASKLVFLPPHLSTHRDTAAKASLLKRESDHVILGLKRLQWLSSTSEEKQKS